MTLDEAREFLTFLRGKGPEGFRLPQRPRLSRGAAFSVLYVLQERFHLVPDSYEECSDCHELFDNTLEGRYDDRTGYHFCGSCEIHNPEPDQSPPPTG